MYADPAGGVQLAEVLFELRRQELHEFPVQSQPIDGDAIQAKLPAAVGLEVARAVAAKLHRVVPGAEALEVQLSAAVGKDALHVIQAIREVDGLERTGPVQRLGADANVQQIAEAEIMHVAHHVDVAARLKHRPGLLHAGGQGIAEFAAQRHVARGQVQVQLVAFGRARNVALPVMQLVPL